VNAVQYALLGYPVLPLKPGAKVPATKRGFKDATLDPVQIAKWGECSNVGIAPNEWTLVIDADSPEEVARLESEFPLLLSAPRCDTPSGGAHFYLQLPEGAPPLKVSVRVQGRKLDVRGLGKTYLVTEPSKVAGGVYRWARPLLHPCDLPQVPETLLELLGEPQKAPKSSAPPPLGQSSSGVLGNRERRYGEAALQREYDAVANSQEGTRNHALNRAAFDLGQLIPGGYLARQEVEEALRGAAATCGLEPREVETTLKGGLDAGIEKPRELPERERGRELNISKPPFPLHQEGVRTVPNGDDLMQRGVALKNGDFASNSTSPVPVGDDLMQRGLHQIAKWGERGKPPPVKWLVKNLLQDNAENLLGGEPGVGKTWIIADLLVSVATGTPFLGRTTSEGPVLFINFDDSETMPRLWAERAAKARGYDFKELPIHYYEPDPSKPYPANGLRTPEVEGFLKSEVERIKPRLIVVDAFSTAFPGADGNKGQDAVRVFEALRQLRVSAGGACVLLVDHTPKEIVMQSLRRGVSGSQQKNARSRSVHIVSQLEPSEVPGGADVLEWRVHKMNAAPRQEPFGISRYVDEAAGTAELQVRGLPKWERAPQASRAAAEALKLIEAQGGGWIARQDLIEEIQKLTGASERTIVEALKSEVEKHPNVRTSALPGRGSPKQYRWHGVLEEFEDSSGEDDLMQSASNPVASNQSASGTEKNPKTDLMQRNDLMQSALHQIIPVPDAKNGFDEMMQRGLENEESPPQKNGALPPELEPLRQRWERGELAGFPLKLPGRYLSDLGKTLETYFVRKRLTDAETHDLLEIAQTLTLEVRP
jgi:hypothetical protein